MPDVAMITPERAMVFIDLMNLYESMGAVEAVKAAGKQIIVTAFARSRSAAVGNAADHEVVLGPAYFDGCY